MTEPNVQRYPLQWPVGWKRCPAAARQRARFHGFNAYLDHVGKRPLTISEALARLLAELMRLGGTRPMVSSNVRLRLDGLPRSGEPEPQDPGVAVYFQLKDKARCLACDRWTRTADNLAAIAAHIGAIRAVDRYGVGTLEQAFAGYAQLPASADEWWTVLGVGRDATALQVEAAYKALARKHHPDAGGDAHQMARINRARDVYRFQTGTSGR